MKNTGKGVFSASQEWRQLYPEGGGFTDLELEAMRGYELSLKALLLSHTARAEDLQINSRGKARRRVVWDIIS